MEQYEVLGIVFRSRGHAVWFGLSMLFVILNIGHQFALRILKPTLPVPYGIGPIFVHMSATYSAIAATHGGIRESGPYTSDCIWFNALMVIVHVFIIIRFRQKKSPVRAYQDGP